MVSNADDLKHKLLCLNECDGPHFKIKNDPRITKIGKLLRKTSLDELPQLFNVLFGNVTFIGPRPMYFGELNLCDERHWRRLSVKPGLLCLREVSGRSKLSFEQWLASDLYYVENKSFGLNLKIMARAIPAILFGFGAY